MMSANTLTARGHVRSPKRSLTTSPSYPRLAEPRRASRPIYNTGTVYKPTGYYGVANRTSAPVVVPQRKPYTRAMARRIKIAASYDYAVSSASFLKDLALQAKDVYTETTVTEETTYIPNSPPSYVASTYRYTSGTPGWYFASVKFNTTPTPYSSWGAMPSRALGTEYETSFVPDLGTATYWFYRRNGYYFGVPRYSKTTDNVKPASTPGWATWPYGTSPQTVEVITEEPAIAFSPAPFPVTAGGFPAYRKNKDPEKSNKPDPKLDKAPGTSPVGVEIGFTPGGKFYARNRRTKGGRDDRERKSFSQKAFVVLGTIVDHASEAIEVYEILREGFGVPDHIHGPEALAYMLKHWDDAVWDQIAIDLAINHYSDKLVGRIHRSMKKGFRNLEFGTIAKLNMGV